MNITNTTGAASARARGGDAVDPQAQKMEEALAASAQDAQPKMSEAEQAQIDTAVEGLIETMAQQVHSQAMSIIRSTKADIIAKPE